MTRTEAQALAEEIVLKLSRYSFERRGLGLDAVAHTFCGGVRAHHGVIQAGGQIMSGQVASLAACAIELLRECFLTMEDSPDEIVRLHAPGPRPAAS